MAGGLLVVCQGLASSIPRPLPLWTLSDTCFPVPWANKSTVLMARDFSEKLPGSGWWEAMRLPDWAMRRLGGMCLGQQLLRGSSRAGRWSAAPVSSGGERMDEMS